MSDPPTTPLPPPSSILADPHRQNLHLPHIHGGATSSTTTSSATIAVIPSSSSSLVREYRKGNWTIQETLILITAKKLDDERRLKTTPQDPTRVGGACGRTSGELRWKWVENYCWSQGCLRSQNQCNDKWDNLLRDYKKVRDYESKSKSSSDGSKDFPSYWSMDKHQRKERNLPSNMMLEVYQAISQVLQRKYAQRSPQQPPPPLVTAISSSPVAIQPPPPPPPPPLPSPTQPPPPSPQAPANSTPAVSERSESLGTECSDEQESESKRRKVKNLGSSIMHSASVLARALRSSEKKKEKRHRELVELEQQRLQIEETRNEINRQGISSLVAAVTNLSGAIQSFISERHDHR